MLDRGPAARGDSGLVVLVPEADPVVDDLRRAHDPAGEAGVTAHVTILFPFIPRAEIDDAAREALRALFAAAAPFGYRFARVERFDDATVFLAPEPVEAFTHLTRLVQRRWPEHPPYGGAFEVVVPHLTVGDRLLPGQVATLADETETRLRERGPIVGRAEAVALLVVDELDRFSIDSAYPLRGG
jgi:2'-5' RNA ligase superfamily